MIETLHEQLAFHVRKALAKSMNSDKRVKDLSAHRRAQADMDVLTRHHADSTGFECMGCGLDSYEEPRVKDIDDCPEIKALAVAYGLLTPEEVFTWSYDG